VKATFPIKKMSKNQNLLSFKPAELYVGKEWYIAYYALNPSTNQLHRKKIKLNRIKSISARRKFAKKVIQEVNEQLYSGWNPLFILKKRLFQRSSFLRLIVLQGCRIFQYYKPKIHLTFEKK
jgi:hypothetical protein